MGKASRGKRRNITRDDAQALRLAGEIILDPRLLETFQSIKLHEKLESSPPEDNVGAAPLLEAPQEPSTAQAEEEKSAAEGFIGQLRQQTPAIWAARIQKALRERTLREQLLASIKAGQQALRGESEFERCAAAFDLDDSTWAEAEQAYSSVRKRLLADLTEPIWLTLVMACFGRAIATNAHQRFADDTWDELTFFMHALERDFLLANGKPLANKLMEFNHVFYEDRLSEIIGSRMPFGLVELACNMADTGLFERVRD